MTTLPMLRLRVVSYNVLSSHLARPSQYPTLKPEHLDAARRLPVILKKLDEELTQHPDNCLFCLQEVSMDWSGAFHTFFASRGYHLVTSHYGKSYNGYMGVYLAWPVSTLDVVHVDVARLADKRVGGWPPRDEPPSTLSKLFGYAQSLASKSVNYLKGTAEERDVPDHWTMSQNRWNVVLTATLTDKATGITFSIANYHMPCAYYAPMVMTIHAEMVTRHVQQIAGVLSPDSSSSSSSQDHEQQTTTEQHAYILAGDWNIKHPEPVYHMLTTGQINEKDHADFNPAPKNGVPWSCNIEAMRSAYAVSDPDGKEPDFTNYSRVLEEEPFIDTLDYIFLSSEWNVRGCKKLPSRDDCGGPFPNLDVHEPSDHVLISADLEIAAKKKPASTTTGED